MLARLFWGVAFFSLTTAVHAAANWFPESLVNIKSANKDSMTMLGELAVSGSKVMFFMLCVYAFYKCVMTISHGIEEAKKNEGGLMAVFGVHTVMAFMYLTISITCGYLGFTMATKFSL